MLTILGPLCLFLLPQTADAAQRRAQVERLLTPSPWVEGHCFGLLERMAALNVPGVSVAVLHEGKLDWAAGYGVRDAKSGAPVTSETLFQAASISKPVSAMAAHWLAQEGQLDLDAPINKALRSWQLPADGFEGEVSARQIMSHMGGLGVHGFGGYASFDPAPSVVQVLDGAGTANSAAVRRIEPAGRRPRYSGGGSTILQLAMSDITGSDFESLMAERVLGPLQMTRSTFAQPLLLERWPDHASGHGDDGRPIAGGFRTHPERFAAGLWTTPSDLARFAIELQEASNFDAGRVLQQEAALGMLHTEYEGMALGLMIETHDDERWFGHGGSNRGFKCDFRASFEGGRGVFIMTNGDLGSQLAGEILRAVARVYDWPEVVEEPLAAVALSAEQRGMYVGRYGAQPDEVSYVSEAGGQLFLRQGARRAQRLAPIGEQRFLVLGSRAEIRFKTEGMLASGLTRGGNEVTPRLEEFERWPLDDLLAGDLEAACAFYREVFEADAEDPMLQADRIDAIASGLWNDGRLVTGLGMAELGSELYPERAVSWFILAEMRASLEQAKAAKAAYQRCLALLPTSDQGWIRQTSTSMLGVLGD